MAKTLKTQQDQFLSIPISLLKVDNRILNALDKMLISYVIGWQRSGKKCTATNQYLASVFGVDLSTLKRTINKLRKLPFFETQPERKKTNKGGHFNKSTKVVHENVLRPFIAHLTTQQGVELLGEEMPHQIYTQVQEEPVLALEQLPVVIQPVITMEQTPVNPLKSRLRKEHVFSQLSFLLDRIDDAFTKEVSQVEIDLRTALMSHSKITQENKFIYNEWISDFMKEDYLEIRSLYSVHENKEQETLATPSKSTDDYYLP